LKGIDASAAIVPLHKVLPVWGLKTRVTKILDRRALLCLPVFCALASCQESAGGIAASGPLVRAPDVPVTILAVDGIPESINEDMLSALSEAATRRGIRLIEADQNPRFQVKGYFSVDPNGAGTVFSYTWDVLNTSTDQTSRIEGSATTPRKSTEPWSVLDDATRNALASQSMNDLARFLATN
jgi:hypothetical protein